MIFYPSFSNENYGLTSSAEEYDETHEKSRVPNQKLLIGISPVVETFNNAAFFSYTSRNSINCIAASKRHYQTEKKKNFLFYYFYYFQ